MEKLGKKKRRKRHTRSNGKTHRPSCRIVEQFMMRSGGYYNDLALCNDKCTAQCQREEDGKCKDGVL